MAFIFDNSTNTITDDTGAAPILGATGTAGDVLTSNGAGAAPTMQTPAGGGGGGAWSLVQTQVVTTSVNAVVFTGLSQTAVSFMLLVRDFTAGSVLSFQLSSDNGVSWITSYDYIELYQLGETGALSGYRAVNYGKIYVGSHSGANAAPDAYDAEIYITSLADITKHTRVRIDANGTESLHPPSDRSSAIGRPSAIGAQNAVKISSYTGVISSATMSLYEQVV